MACGSGRRSGALIGSNRYRDNPFNNDACKRKRRARLVGPNWSPVGLAESEKLGADFVHKASHPEKLTESVYGKLITAVHSIVLMPG